MAEINVFVDSGLLREIDRIAAKQYGDDGQESRRRLVEAALEMRILWSNKVDHGQDQTEESVSQWQFIPSNIGKNGGDDVRDWMFRR